MNYATTCFVIMPFDEKDVIDERGQVRKVDFNRIYDEIFEPAIRAVALPEGGSLQPRRTDRDFFAGDISQDMFEYLEYSRIALTDISGLNANVLYELGVRHRARPSGTVVFRQIGAKIPFDLSQIKAFPYEYEPDDRVAESRGLITRVLGESLIENRIDSPVRRALEVQRAQGGHVEADIRAAENAIRLGDRPRAVAALETALAGSVGNPLLHLRLGLLLKDAGQWKEALAHFERALALAPEYAEAWREKGIAQNKLFVKAGRPAGVADGIDALARAVTLNKNDYDAHASLGGALKRAGQLADALAAYECATEVSQGHSYPLLNAIKLDAQLNGRLEIGGKRRFQLQRASRSLRAQIASDPPYDPPWSFFDLAEIALFSDQREEFERLADLGTQHATAKWQIETFQSSLQALVDAGVDVPGLAGGISLLKERASYLT